MTINFSVNLPYDWSKHRSMKWFSKHAHGSIGEHKGWEFQSDYFGWTNLFSIDLDLIPTGSDHAGIGVSITILGFMIDAKVYDSRHWNQETGSWEAYDEESINFRISRNEQEEINRLEAARQLVAADDRKQARLNAEEFLASPQGQNLISAKVKEKLAEQKANKEAKKARGEQYRAANIERSPE